MNTRITFRDQSSKSVRDPRLKNRLLSVVSPAAALAAAALLLPSLGWAGGVVTTCTEAALRTAMAGGGTVIFACDGTITLASTITNDVSITLDATGRQVTVSGGNALQVFFVNSNVTLTLINLTIANGQAANGGALFNNGGTVNAQNCVFRSNSAVSGLDGLGGALYNAGSLTANRCIFSLNSATGPGGSSNGGARNGLGGALYNTGTAVLVTCTLASNSCTGGQAMYGLDNYTTNGAGGAGGTGSYALGGAVANWGTLIVRESAFFDNAVTGGKGGHGGTGGPGDPKNHLRGGTGGRGGNGGAASGSALYNNGTAALLNCTFASNRCAGGDGAAGGWGGPGGGICPQWGENGPGGAGGFGGPSVGAIYDAAGLLSLTNCTVAFNNSVVSSGGAGGPGGAPFGCNYQGATGTRGGDNGGTAGIRSSDSRVENTLLATNSLGGNGAGRFTDLGHNLSSDDTCNFTNSASKNNTDPRLSPLANNGGPTMTMALISGSPAIDAADTSAAPDIDQRGAPRPIGPAADIGAFEFGSPAMLRINGSAVSGLDLLVLAAPGQTCRLLVSSNFSNWTPVATNQIGSDGTTLFHDNCAPGGACRFYRIAMP